MNSDRQHFDDTIRDAVADHGAALDADVPDFGALIEVRHRRTRRTLAAATAAVALLGVAGVVVATNRTEAPAAADIDVADTPDSDRGTVSAASTTTTIFPLPAPTEVTEVTAPATMPVEYSCTDPIGEDQLGRQLFGSCEPTSGGVATDYACTGRVGTDAGFVIFSTCEPIGQLGPIPGGDDDAPFDDPNDVPVRPTTYVVRPGDYGIKIADEFCVSVSDLESVNGWTDAARDFPGPGNQILIPSGFDQSSCDLGSYTITATDTSRFGVADQFCISVQALDTANADTEGYHSFYPGLVIIIPPSSDNAC